jgi:hypothetical protein
MRGDRRPAKGTGSFTCRSLSEGWALAADCAALVGQRLTARARERAASATVTSIERGLTQSPTTWTSRPRPRAGGDDVLDHHRLGPVDQIVAASFDAWGMSA